MKYIRNAYIALRCEEEVFVSNLISLLLIRDSPRINHERIYIRETINVATRKCFSEPIFFLLRKWFLTRVGHATT